MRAGWTEDRELPYALAVVSAARLAVALCAGGSLADQRLGNRCAEDSARYKQSSGQPRTNTDGHGCVR